MLLGDDDVAQDRMDKLMVKDRWRGFDFWCRCRCQGEPRAAFVAVASASLVHHATLVAGLQMQLGATIIAEMHTRRIQMVAEKALNRG